MTRTNTVFVRLTMSTLFVVSLVVSVWFFDRARTLYFKIVPPVVGVWSGEVRCVGDITVPLQLVLEDDGSRSVSVGSVQLCEGNWSSCLDELALRLSYDGISYADSVYTMRYESDERLRFTRVRGPL